MSPRRGRGEGSIYKRGDGVWVASLDLGVVSGKRRRVSRYARTRQLARRSLMEMQREHETHQLVSSPTLTVEGWLKHWFEEIAPHKVRYSTLRGYRTYVDQWLIPNLGAYKLRQLEPDHVRALYATMRSQGKSETTIRQAHAILRRALQVAMNEGKVYRNVAALVDPPKTTERKERRALTAGEVGKVLAKADEGDRPDRWYVALYLGIRQGEALGLKWSDVDLNPDDPTLTVNRSVERVKGEGMRFTEPKSRASKGRSIPLPQIVATRLMVAWAAHVNAGGIRDDLVWPGKTGGIKDPRRDYQEWIDLLEAAGVERTALHAARNTTASLMMGAHVPDKLQAELLGQSNVRVTHGYQQGSDPMRVAAMRAIEAAVEDAE